MQEMTLPALIENIPRVTAWIDETLEKLDCSMKAQMQIDMAIDEIFSNISRYAYPDGPGSATVRLSFDEGSRMFSINLRCRVSERSVLRPDYLQRGCSDQWIWKDPERRYP